MILICFGTRPEYIKVKSLIDNCKHIKTLFTGQHADLLKNIDCTYKIKITQQTNNRLNNIMASILTQSDIFEDIDYVLVQGDTTSALAVAISAFNNNKKVIHLEAGLRTYDKTNPYPEEMNRVLISQIAYIHLCPTDFNKGNLFKEGICDNIHVVGNTGLDNIDNTNCEYGNTVLITMHRRDNHDTLDIWFTELSRIASIYTDLNFIIPLHPNPNVQKHKHLLKNIKIIKPVTHEKLIDIMKTCLLIITDSGGLQEESSFLHKKVIVCRKTTERQEIMNKNLGYLCRSPINLDKLVKDIYDDPVTNVVCPYVANNDKKAWINIKDILNRYNINI